MGRKRYIVEIGTGADLHGGDVTKAAQRAVKDAVSRSCLCGLFDILGIDSPHRMYVEVKLGCPQPEMIREAEVLAMIPFGTASLEVAAGGLAVRGLALPELGAGDTIVIAVAAVTVYVDMDG
ncbi:MAG: Lin0512 family protein [Negativicutes bacterium]|nr:Lin0512 family protein [Negativicutes bacterium]